MRDMELHGSIGVGRSLAQMLLQRLQVADSCLGLFQQSIALLFAEQIYAQIGKLGGARDAVVKFIQHANEIPAKAPPTGKQWVTVRVQFFQRHGGQIIARTERLTATLRVQQLSPADNVAPIKLARIRYGSDDLHVRG